MVSWPRPPLMSSSPPPPWIRSSPRLPRMSPPPTTMLSLPPSPKSPSSLPRPTMLPALLVPRKRHRRWYQGNWRPLPLQPIQRAVQFRPLRRRCLDADFDATRSQAFRGRFPRSRNREMQYIRYRRARGRATVGGLLLHVSADNVDATTRPSIPESRDGSQPDDHKHTVIRGFRTVALLTVIVHP